MPSPNQTEPYYNNPAYMLLVDWFYILGAREDDSVGTNCGNCGKINLFADDCGWFYLQLPYPKTLMNPIKTGYLAVCRSCAKQSGHPEGDR